MKDNWSSLMRAASDQNTKRILKAAKAAGWTARISGGGHIILKTPTGAPYVIPQTPSDHRSTKNSIAFLRRAGLDV